MLFKTTDDRIKNLEKRVNEMEKRVNKTLTSVNDALLTMSDVITNIHKESQTLKKEKDSIDAKQKQIANQINDVGIKRDVKENIIEPIKNSITENIEFLQEIAKEDFTQKNMNGLLRLVEKEGEIGLQNAAAKMKVHPLQAEHWAKILKNQKSLDIIEKNNKKYLCRITRKKSA